MNTDPPLFRSALPPTWTFGIYPGWQHRPLNRPWCPPWQRWSGRASNMAELMDPHAGPQPPTTSALSEEERWVAFRVYREDLTAWSAKRRLVQVHGWTYSGCERKLRRAVAML